MALFSKLFGGSKSEKDVKKIWPRVADINQHFASYQSITNDQLRNKTNEFRERIKEYLKEIDAEIADKNKKADELPYNDLLGKDAKPDLVELFSNEKRVTAQTPPAFLARDVTTGGICALKRLTRRTQPDARAALATEFDLIARAHQAGDRPCRHLEVAQ